MLSPTEKAAVALEIALDLPPAFNEGEREEQEKRRKRIRAAVGLMVDAAVDEAVRRIESLRGVR